MFDTTATAPHLDSTLPRHSRTDRARTEVSPTADLRKWRPCRNHHLPLPDQGVTFAV